MALKRKTQTSEPDIFAKLREQGVDEAMISELQNNMVPKGELTRMRQSDKAELDQVRQQLAYLAGQVQTGGSQKAVSPTEAYLAKLPDTDEGRSVKELLIGYGQALRQELEGRISPVLQDIQGTTKRSERRRAIDDYLARHMVPQYGDDVKEFWPEIAAEVERQLDAGAPHVNPEIVFRSLDPELEYELLTKRRAKDREQHDNEVIEGFAETSRRVPSISQAEVPVRSKGESGGDAPFVFDPESVAASAMAEVAKVMRKEKAA